MPAPYTGKLLRVNLTSGHTQVEEIPKLYYDLFMGGRGLGAALLYDEVRPGADPLNGEENRLIFTTGPLTALGASGTAKAVVHCLSPLTGIYLFSVTSKTFGIRLKKAGYDALIIQGVAPQPAVLVIKDGAVHVRDGKDVWGLTVDEAENRLLAELGAREFSVAAIGPAGENRVRYACIINDGGRAFGRGGAGAVMGAMGLKAIAVAGHGRVDAVDPTGWRAALNHEAQYMRESPRTKLLADVGTPGSVDNLHDLGCLPVKNFQSATIDWVDKTGVSALRQHKTKNTACPPCVVACTQWTRGTTPDGETWESEGPEYETMYSFGLMLEIQQFPYIIKADKLCDQLGIDTMSAGVTIAFAMECWEKGLLTARDTGGVDLSWGNGGILAGLLSDIAHRRGFGDFLAEGTARMAREIGQGSDAWAIQTKGMEFGGYDPRGAKGMALVYAAGARGGCHHAGGRTVVAENGPGMNPFAEAGKGALTRTCRAERIAFDCAVLCTFNTLPMDEITALLAPALGRPVTRADMIALGDRVSHIERLFNSRLGLRRAQDTLPARLTTEPLNGGPGTGQVVHLDGMLSELYTVSGWDVATGVPLPDQLQAHGMEKWIPDARAMLGTTP